MRRNVSILNTLVVYLFVLLAHQELASSDSKQQLQPLLAGSDSGYVGTQRLRSGGVIASGLLILWKL